MTAEGTIVKELRKPPKIIKREHFGKLVFVEDRPITIAKIPVNYTIH